MQFRNGDIVSMTGTIKYDYDEDDKERVFVRVDGSTEDLWVSPKILKLVQAKFEVSDMVCWPDAVSGYAYGEVVAIANAHAWIILPNGDYCTRHFGAIERMAPQAIRELENADDAA